MKRALALVAALLSLQLPGTGVITPAAAQSGYEITAVAYRDLAAGIPVRVRLLDDSDLNQQVRDLVVEQLAAAGYQVADDADFVLQVETLTAADPARDPSLGSFRAGTEGAEIRMNLWSSREDSLLQGRRGGVPGPSEYRISLGLYDGRDGRYFWRGWVSSVLEGGNAAEASRSMVPALLEQFGKTFRATPAVE